MAETGRRIAHIDMDAFFASVELLRYPQLRGQPVVIGGRGYAPEQREDGSYAFKRLRDYVGRGVITTATYEARAFGVGSAMGMMKAAKLAPDAILLPANFDAYRHYSRLFKEAVASIAPDIEDRGIDEIFVDLTHVEGETRELGARIKQAVQQATGLTCSVGITPNKLLSKICSDLEKPNGLTVLGFDDIPSRIWPLSVRKVNGIGPKATAKLAALGIETVGQLAQADQGLLQDYFGAHYAAWLARAAHGIDERELSTSRESKSISRETTFERDLHARQDREALSAILVNLCERLEEDLKRKGYVSRTISIKLRYDDFQIVSRNVTLPQPVAEAAAILQAARECLKRVPLQRKLRLLGVRASTLETPGATVYKLQAVQGDLFD
ncbi:MULTISPECIES: DNA polymerase IV [unclassified Duganella]|uniref:DNA polymerase IV n=1 Tax=unclassified Duganella TaxID=2636909 RepID=UPI00088EF87D|nr:MULTISPECIES: DNA polymerase IV [unclassified Duganella]SDH24789.1 DNA polymerase-4 [Duganella sp. OV458]SDK43441.1 DNA polymerase-4 [Duganella sp. OV510]